MITITRFYPRASEHLRTARVRRSEMADRWKATLDEGFLGEAVLNDTEDAGRIVVYANWPLDRRAELTALFRHCVDELWKCLDALIVESVEQFSVLHYIKDSTRPRFFAIADSIEGFQALLEESCLDGILTRHFQMVRAGQPFLGPSGDERLDRIRDGLRQLLDWDHSLEAGAQLGAWATPECPRVRVQPPATLKGVEVCNAGELADEHVVATYRLGNYESGCQVEGRAGTCIDLCLPAGFSPVCQEDTFDSRLRTVFEAVQLICAHFAYYTRQVQSSRRVLLGERAHASPTWTSAADSPRRWTNEELAALQASDLGLGHLTDSGDEITLVIATPDGIYERVVPRVTPVRAHPQVGIAAEDAVRDAAATWGLPDFVMLPSVERKGKGQREISDGLLVVGYRGVVVQSKARETEPGSTEREASWIDK